MLYYLLFFVLHKHWSPLNVFRYLTVRTAIATLTSLFLSLALGPWVIRRLRELQIGQLFAKKDRAAIKPKPARRRWAAY